MFMFLVFFCFFFFYKLWRMGIAREIVLQRNTIFELLLEFPWQIAGNEIDDVWLVSRVCCLLCMFFFPRNLQSFFVVVK
ncbi:hypothetical protein OIU79_020127 [Salix purpurea]|uniref:Uncharacterized protein n=1 Tax=Salix purpurea TaxID=77065 RepID=A0A9Q0P2V3_SALPP|nr:hypothetical protein OIU79_020127 [Salix purpurea]